MKDWSMLGVVASEGGQRTSIDGRELNRVREIVPAIAGTVDTVDIWSTEKNYICKNTTLWLILKRVKNPMKYVLDGNNHFRFNYTGQIGDQPTQYVKRPFQFVPYASRNYELPPIDELVYKDLDGTKEIGVPYAVGRVRDVPPGRELQSFGPNAWFDQSKVPMLPKFEMVARSCCP
jgi:hypothetical protein